MISVLKNIPVISLFIEKLEGTLCDCIKDKLCLNDIKSCLFQISFALNYLQKKYYFTHNDLHVCNVMYTTTTKQYIYYKLNNCYFKIPTFGKIWKIIDFGRSIITFKNKIFMNDSFSKYGEAEGQYMYNSSIPYMKNKEGEKPSFYFDLCRLSITILDEIRYRYEDEVYDLNSDDLIKIYDHFIDFMKFMSTDKNGVRLDKENDDFDLYINITKNARNTLPNDIMMNDFFKIIGFINLNFLRNHIIVAIKKDTCLFQLELNL